MKDELYYTPELDEFHIGFEYEWKCESTRTPWTKSIMTNSNSPVKDEDAWRVNDYRIKYLDKDDIEDLGFTHEGGKLSLYGSQYFTKRISDAINHDTVIRIEKTQHIIEITSSFEGGMDDMFYTRFHGYCKNKSELKTILNQICI